MNLFGVAIQIGGLSIRWYGIMIVLAMIFGVWWACFEARRQHQDVEKMFDLCLLLLPCAIIGARIYYVLTHLSQYDSFWEVFKVWEGGLAVHGGILLCVIAACIYVRRHNLSFWRWTDILVPGVIVGQAIGRLGNYFNGELYGPVTDLPWAMYIAGAYRHPTFLYEIICNLLSFGILLFLMKRPHRQGEIFSWYLILYSIGRFFIEFLREDKVMLGEFPIPGSSIVSLACIALGIGLLLFLRRYPRINVYAKN